MAIEKILTGSIDLSKATKLKDVTLVSERYPRFIASTLKTVTPDHRNLRQITVFTTDILYSMDSNPHNQKTTRAEWLGLDSVFIKLWESHSIHPKVQYDLPSLMDAEKVRQSVESLFPETTRREVVDLSIRELF